MNIGIRHVHGKRGGEGQTEKKRRRKKRKRSDKKKEIEVKTEKGQSDANEQTDKSSILYILA
jgi:hypothetical protein